MVVPNWTPVKAATIDVNLIQMTTRERDMSVRIDVWSDFV